jgi:hypothetical protein
VFSVLIELEIEWAPGPVWTPKNRNLKYLRKSNIDVHTIRYQYRISVEEPERKRPLSRSRDRWAVN